MQNKLNLNDPRIPHIGNKNDLRQQEEDKIRTMLQQPNVAAAIAGMAEELAKNFNESTRLIADIRVGATFKDMWSKPNKRYTYEYLSRGFQHDLRAKVVMEQAKKPVKTFDPAEYYMVIYETDSNPSPRYIIDAYDFCKYFAIGAWVIEDMNNSDEKEFLNKVAN
jgi:hypothetical protein